MGVVITSSTLNDIFTGWNTKFNEIYGAIEDTHLLAAMDIPSESDSETLAWLDMFPGVREFIGSRQYNDLKALGRNVPIKEWEDTIWLKRTDVEDDKIGLYNKRLEMLATAAKAHKAKLVFDLLPNGFTATGYDGAAFFSASHTWRGKTVSNLLTTALTSTNFDTAIQTLMENLGSFGAANESPLIINPEFRLFAGPALRSKAKEIIEAQLIGGGDTNTNFGAADVVISPLLTGNKWYVMVKNSPLMPLVFINRLEYELSSVTDPESDLVFDKAAFAYGYRARYAADYGLWQLALGSTGAS